MRTSRSKTWFEESVPQGKVILNPPLETIQPGNYFLTHISTRGKVMNLELRDRKLQLVTVFTVERIEGENWTQFVLRSYIEVMIWLKEHGYPNLYEQNLDFVSDQRGDGDFLLQWVKCHINPPHFAVWWPQHTRGQVERMLRQLLRLEFTLQTPPSDE